MRNLSTPCNGFRGYMQCDGHTVRPFQLHAMDSQSKYTVTEPSPLNTFNSMQWIHVSLDHPSSTPVVFQLHAMDSGRSAQSTSTNTPTFNSMQWILAIQHSICLRGTVELSTPCNGFWFLRSLLGSSSILSFNSMQWIQSKARVPLQ